VNPADYADAAIRSRDEMLRQATNSYVIEHILFGI